MREVKIAGANEAMLYRRRLKDILESMVAANLLLAENPARRTHCRTRSEIPDLGHSHQSPGVSLDVLNEFYGRTAEQPHETVREIIGSEPAGH